MFLIHVAIPSCNKNGRLRTQHAALWHKITTGFLKFLLFCFILVLNIIKFVCALKHSEDAANSFFETGF